MRNREPWAMERALHLALGAVAILGWIVAYTALTLHIEAPQDSTREHASHQGIGESHAIDAGRRASRPDTATSNA